MLPHTGLFLLGKVALQMRIRRVFKTSFSFDIFRNFFHRYDRDFIEIQFPDSSTLLIKLDEAK
ncbi:hypothetical protein M5098_11455, partial [Neisseria meningitidis]|nr:hypothetical protein [Neisseria meningitidis]